MLVMFLTKVPRTPEKVPRDPLGVPRELLTFLEDTYLLEVIYVVATRTVVSRWLYRVPITRELSHSKSRERFPGTH